MNIYYNLDTLNAREGVSNLITGSISIKVSDTYYPELDWNDFIVVISTWWLNEFHDFLIENKAFCEFCFMDGPYKMIIENQDSKLRCWTTDRDGKPTKHFSDRTDNIYYQLLELGRNLINHCKTNNWETKDVYDLFVAHNKFQILNSRFSQK